MYIWWHIVPKVRLSLLNNVFIYIHTYYSQVLDAVAGIKEMDKNEVADAVYQNTTKLFFKSWDTFADFIQERIRGRDQVRGPNKDGILRIFNDVPFGVEIVTVV